MMSFDNPGPLEMLVRKGTNGEVWVQQVIDALVDMLPESAATATKKMTMDESTKAELEAAKEESAMQRERLQEVLPCCVIIQSSRASLSERICWVIRLLRGMVLLHA